MRIPSPEILTPDVRAVVFDLDGTLYAKRGMVWHIICSEWRDLHYLIAERLTRLVMRGCRYADEAQFYDAFFRGMASCRLFSAEQARTWYNERYMPHMVEVIRSHFHLAEWVPDFQAACKQKNLRVAIYSDYGYVREKMHVLGLDEKAFDVVISAAELGGLKPNAETASILCEQLGVMCKSVLFVGDRRKTDGATAKNVGGKYFRVKF